MAGNRLPIGTYDTVPELGLIIARTNQRSYGVLYKGNFVEITGNSHTHALARLLTWLACVVMTDNSLPLEQGLFLHEQYSLLLKCSAIRKDTIKWLENVIDYIADDICFQMPLFIFDGRDYWELLIDSLRSGQYVPISQIQTIVIRSSWTRFILFHDGTIEEIMLDFEDGKYFYKDTFCVTKKPGDFIKQIVINRVQDLLANS